MVETSRVINVDEASFENDVVLRSYKEPVVVDFWAAWCGPCRMLGPTLEKLAEEPNSGFILAKVDVDSNPSLAMRFGVQGIPAVKAFKDGKVAGEFVGAQPEANVRKFTESLTPDDSEIRLESAAAQFNAGLYSEAETSYRLLLEETPAQPDAVLGLAKTLIALGNGCEAVELLDNDSANGHYRELERLVPLAQFMCPGHVFPVTGETELDAIYAKARSTASQRDFSGTMELLLDILREDKKFRDGEAKLIMLGIFEFLGESDPVTNQYRRRLASVLF